MVAPLIALLKKIQAVLTLAQILSAFWLMVSAITTYNTAAAIIAVALMYDAERRST
jgi:hypothetical protein